MINPIIVEFKEVCKSYGKHQIFKDFSLQVQRGEFLSIIGTSGSGKTTLLRMINGLERLDSGSVIVDGEDIATKSEREMVALRRKIGYCVQGDGLFPHLNVRDNICYVPKLLHQKVQNLEKILQMVQLDSSFLTRYPDELSGGQRQRVGVARSLCANAKIILMDEPFGALDELTKQELQNEIYAIYKTQHLSVFFVTHDIKEALKLGSRILVLDNGKIEFFGTRDEIVNATSAFTQKLLSSVK